MPRELFGADFAFLPRAELLTFEEIARLARIFANLGVEKIRVTGGEPLLRRDLEKLIGLLVQTPGIRDLAMTTNGSLLAKMASPLRASGLGRITVSLDSLDDTIFAAMNDAEFTVARVLEGIDAALSAGFSPLKINMVVKRGVNETSIVPMARHFRGPQFILRFIEYMDVGNSNAWQLGEVVSGEEIIQKIANEMPLVPLAGNYPGEVVKRFRHIDGGGEIGVITSVTNPFCADCSRVRLSSNGQLYTCLFAESGFDLRALLRRGCDDVEIAASIQTIWSLREDRYSEQRASQTNQSRKVEMSHLGG